MRQGKKKKERTPWCPSLLSSNGTCSLVQAECHSWMGLSKPEPCLSVMLPLKPKAFGCCSQSDKAVASLRTKEDAEYTNSSARSSCTYLLVSTPLDLVLFPS